MFESCYKFAVETITPAQVQAIKPKIVVKCVDLLCCDIPPTVKSVSLYSMCCYNSTQHIQIFRKTGGNFIGLCAVYETRC